MLGERLALARKNKGLTQMDLAVALGDRYTQSMISVVENGRSILLLEGAIRAAKELDVSLDWLGRAQQRPCSSADPARLHSRRGASYSLG